MRMKLDVQTLSTDKLKKDLLKNYEDVLFESMIKMEKLAKEKAPVDTGTLKARIHLDPVERGHKKYILSDGIEYGIDLEYGNRPHKVKWEAIEKWIRRKGIRTTEGGIYAFTKYVVKKIRTEGVNAQPFFRPAFDEVKYKWLPIIKKRVFSNNAQT